MTSRSEQLRRQHRRVMKWSLAAAVVLHAIALVYWAAFSAAAPEQEAVDAWRATDVRGDVVDVGVRFGPPVIANQDGTVVAEPPERVLTAGTTIVLAEGCGRLGEGPRPAFTGSVRLTVGEWGHAAAVRVHQTTGDACADEAMSVVAGQLRYRWLPSDRYPAPVDVIQPMRLAVGTD